MPIAEVAKVYLRREDPYRYIFMLLNQAPFCELLQVHGPIIHANVQIGPSCLFRDRLWIVQQIPVGAADSSLARI